MTLEERVYKLHELAQDCRKLNSIVTGMEIIENAPVYNSVEWHDLRVKYNQVMNHLESLEKQLGLRMQFV